MEVVVHFPNTEREKEILERRIAVIQGEFVLSYIDKLDCPYWQKEKLMDEIVKQLKNKKERVTSI